MLVITGTQRSGTSFMAKLFKESGYDLGTDFWDDRIDGGLENPTVCNFFRDLVGSNTFPFSKFWDLIDNKKFESFINYNIDVVKFSYLLSIPNFVKHWYNARGTQDLFLVMDRDLSSVIKSKNSRNVFANEDYLGLHQTLDELTHNIGRSINLLEHFGMPYFKIEFPIKDPKAVLHEIHNQTKGNFTIPMDVWDRVFDHKKIHFK